MDRLWLNTQAADQDTFKSPLVLKIYCSYSWLIWPDANRICATDTYVDMLSAPQLDKLFTEQMILLLIFLNIHDLFLLKVIKCLLLALLIHASPVDSLWPFFFLHSFGQIGKYTIIFFNVALLWFPLTVGHLDASVQCSILPPWWESGIPHQKHELLSPFWGVWTYLHLRCYRYLCGENRSRWTDRKIYITLIYGQITKKYHKPTIFKKSICLYKQV